LTTLYIFGDESGTMPLSDNGKPFVAATVSVIGEPPTLIKGSDNDEKMLEIFTNLKAMPSAAIVKPFPGYGKALRAKHDKINLMARATRLVTGADAKYLDQKTLAEGFDLRNTVWGFAMVQSIASAVISTLYTNSIGSIHIILDRKTLRPAMRSFFKELVSSKLAVGTREVLEDLLPMNPGVVSEWISRLKFSSKTTLINWSDDSDGFEHHFGLRLADRLARKIYQGMITNQPGIEAILQNAGFEDFVIDISELVTRLDQGVVDYFRNKTGLPEPWEL